MELRTIVDQTVYGPAINQTAFPSTPTWFWTSSPYAGSSGDAWGVGFYNGYSYYDDVGLYNRVRCVR